MQKMHKTSSRRKYEAVAVIECPNSEEITATVDISGTKYSWHFILYNILSFVTGAILASMITFILTKRHPPNPSISTSVSVIKNDTTGIQIGASPTLSSTHLVQYST